MTPSELREILADALDGAAARLRADQSHSGESRMRHPRDGSPDSAAPLVPAGRLALSVEEAAECLGVGRSAMYDAVKSGRVPIVRFGRRILVPVHGLQQWLIGESGTAPARP